MNKTGYLDGKQVYLAGPMFACQDDGVGWRDFITPKLLEHGLNVVDPTKKTAFGVGEVADDKRRFKEMIKAKQFHEAKEAFKIIVRKDLSAVDHSHFLVAYYDPTVHMLGTIHEFVQAHKERKPILVKYDEENLEHFNVWLLTVVKPEWLFSTWEDMFAYINKINNREFSEMDLDFWAPE